MREKTEERIEREECAKEERDTGRNTVDRAEYEREKWREGRNRQGRV